MSAIIIIVSEEKTFFSLSWKYAEKGFDLEYVKKVNIKNLS